MSISLYASSVGVFVRNLTNLQAILEKSEAYAAERKFSPDVLVTARLAPDMNPLSFQIQAVTDRSKLFVARVIGQPAPSWADDETTFAQLKARVAKGLDYHKSIPPTRSTGSRKSWCRSRSAARRCSGRRCSTC